MKDFCKRGSLWLSYFQVYLFTTTGYNMMRRQIRTTTTTLTTRTTSITQPRAKLDQAQVKPVWVGGGRGGWVLYF